MPEKEKKRTPGISRREFLKDAGIVAGGMAIGSTFFLSACGERVEVSTVTTTAPGTTKTVTSTAPGATQTVTSTAPGTTSTVTTTKTATATVTKYICPVCNQEFDSLAALKAHYDAEHVTASRTTPVTLTINKRGYTVEVKPYTTLQEVLHDQLGYTSVKNMCAGHGTCGSCSVILSGKTVLSCMVLAVECNGKAVETAEGIAQSAHPIIAAYTNSHCMQCGYCTPGFLVTSKALLDRKPNPTIDQIREALSGNICRCGTYPQHVTAILNAAKNLGG